MSEPIRLGIENNYDPPNPLKPPRVEITDAIAAEIVRRALVHDDTVRAGIKGLVQRLEDNTKPPEADAAALRTKLDRIQDALGVPMQHVGDERVDEVYAIEQIRAKLAKIEKDKADAAGELLVDISDCRPGTLAGKLLSANVILRNANSDLLSRAADAERERDNALNDVAVLRGTLKAMNDQMKDQSARHVKCFSDLAACRSALRDIASTVGGNVGENCSNEFHCLVRGEVQIVVDKLRADLAASRESEDRFRGEVAAAFRKHGLAAGPEAIAGLVRDLAAMKERLDQSMLAAGETQDAPPARVRRAQRDQGCPGRHE